MVGCLLRGSLLFLLLAAAGVAQDSEASPLGQRKTGLSSGRQGAFDPFNPSRVRTTRAARLAGRVTLPDGSPPPAPALIERNCEGRVFADAFSDAKGRFSFEVGGDSTITFVTASVEGVNRLDQDPFGGQGALLASAEGREGAVDLIGCRLQASLAGFRSSSIELGRRSAFDNPNVGVIVLYPLDPSAGSSVSVTSLEAPRAARKAYAKAIGRMTQRRPDRGKAAAELEEAVTIYPRYAAAWSLLGRLRLSAAAPDGAAEAFERAVEADPQQRAPYLPLIQIALQRGDWATADKRSETLTKLSPNLPEARYYRALACFNLEHYEQARTELLALFAAGSAEQFAHARHLLGSIYSRIGNYQAAAAQLRAFVRERPDDPLAEQSKAFLADWEQRGLVAKAPPPAANP